MAPWFPVSELKFSISLTKIIRYFLSQRKFRASVVGKISTARDIQAGVPPGSVLPLTFYYIYIYIYKICPSDDTCTYATDRKEGLVLESCSEVSVLLRLGVGTGT
jgi:hypothetical protein